MKGGMGRLHEGDLKWLQVIRVCLANDLPIDDLMFWKEHRDHSTALARAKVIKQLLASGLTWKELKKLCGLSKSAIYKAAG